MKWSLFLFLILFMNRNSFGEVLTFQDVWKNVYEKSHELESVRKEKEANDLASDRGALHWLPKVSLMGQWSDTNDPGQVFINYLGQRSVMQSDFNPSSLNYPGRKQFVNGGLRVELPLYEGGMKVNQSSMLDAIAKASELEVKAKRTEEFTELSKNYGGLIIFNNHMDSLKGLKSDLTRIISSYEVGSKSNPVGYSGLLGLKGLANRIEGLLTGYELESQNKKNWITNKAGLSSDWNASRVKDIHVYLDQTFISEGSVTMSSLLAANEMKVSSMNFGTDMEKARYLPKVGLFAQNNLYSGSRSTQNSQALGVFFQWELFNSESYNKTSEARARAMAAESKLRAAKQDESIMRSTLSDSRTALEKNLSLLSDTSELLNEQTKNAMRLFKSGLLTALQLAEVINRRVDVIEQKNKIEIQYVEVRAGLHQLSH